MLYMGSKLARGLKKRGMSFTEKESGKDGGKRASG